jgi:transposase-like protein
MAAPRKHHPPEFKAKVALEAAKGDRTLAQLAAEFGVSSIQICQWKRQLLEGVTQVFSRKEPVSAEEISAPLFQEIGRLKMELDWVKKKYGTFS